MPMQSMDKGSWDGRSVLPPARRPKNYLGGIRHVPRKTSESPVLTRRPSFKWSQELQGSVRVISEETESVDEAHPTPADASGPSTVSKRVGKEKQVRGHHRVHEPFEGAANGGRVTC